MTTNLSVVPRVQEYTGTPQVRFAEACDAALMIADRVADRVISRSADPIAVALASNLRDLIALTKRLPQ